jgi:NADH dehydrogenase/NADH:ubiquinone oxidoreductase subunit G
VHAGAEVALWVDGNRLRAREGRTVLSVCLENGVYIPNLCHLEGAEEPPASCRLCFVEVEGQEGPRPSCTLPVREAMRVRTDTPVVRRLQRSAFRLLISTHDTDCRHCPANRRCALQRIARHLGVGLKPGELPRRLKEPGVDESHPHLQLYPNRCVLCSRCIETCRRRHGHAILAYTRRGFDTVLQAMDEMPACPDCRACPPVCPTAAIVLRAVPGLPAAGGEPRAEGPA